MNWTYQTFGYTKPKFQFSEEDLLFYLVKTVTRTLTISFYQKNTC